MKNSLIILFLVGSVVVFGQGNTLTDNFPDIKFSYINDPAPGYFFIGARTVVNPENSRYLGIIDNSGTPVFFRKMNGISANFRLLKDGRMSYTYGQPRKLYIMDEYLEVTDTFSTVGFDIDGHDYDIDDSNGHIALMGRSERSIDMSTLVTGGLPDATVLDFVIQEFDPDGNILLNWNSIDHMDILEGVEESPYVDFTEQQVDYAHPNALCFDQTNGILVSLRHTESIIKIDRTTGEIVWRLGGKNNDFTFINDEIGFSHQHGIRSLPNGNIILFDNGNLHEEQITSSVEYEIDEINMTATLVKRYYRFPDVYSNHGGNTQRVENGNTIASWGPYWPSLTEFHPDGSIAIDLDFTHHSFSPRNEKYQWKTRVFGTDFDSLYFDTWEGTPLSQNISITNNMDYPIELSSFSQKSDNFSIQEEFPIPLNAGESKQLTFSFEPKAGSSGKLNDLFTLNYDLDSQRVARQVWVFGDVNDDIAPYADILPAGYGVGLDSVITVHFSEAVVWSNEEEIDYMTSNDMFTVRSSSTTGPTWPIRTYYDKSNHTATIISDIPWTTKTNYFVSVNDELMDYSGNLISPSTAEFFTGTLEEWIILGTNDDLTDLSVKDFTIYPNPADEHFKFISSLNQPLKLRLVGLNGQEFQTLEVDPMLEYSVDLSEYPNGLYHLLIYSESHTFLGSRRIIIMR